MLSAVLRQQLLQLVPPALLVENVVAEGDGAPVQRDDRAVSFRRRPGPGADSTLVDVVEAVLARGAG